MSTAIVGLGNIGSRLAKNLTTGGEKIIVAERTLEKADRFAKELGGNAQAMSVPDAIKKSYVVILAIYLDAIKQFVATYRDLLVGKIVVDPSNPIAPDGKGGFKKTIPANQSSGQIVSTLLPKGARFVKAFGTLSAGSLASGANRTPERAVLFYATDDSAAGRPWRRSLAPVAFRLSVLETSTNRFASRWAAICTSSGSSAGWFPRRRRRR
jgi:predicted dinucleotide-binding enzyme